MFASGLVPATGSRKRTADSSLCAEMQSMDRPIEERHGRRARPEHRPGRGEADEQVAPVTSDVLVEEVSIGGMCGVY